MASVGSIRCVFGQFDCASTDFCSRALTFNPSVRREVQVVRVGGVVCGLVALGFFGVVGEVGDDFFDGEAGGGFAGG